MNKFKFHIWLWFIGFLPQDEEDEKLKKPKTIDAKEVQKVKEKKKKELEDVRRIWKLCLTKYNFQQLLKGKKKAKEKGKRMSYVVTESGIVQVIKCLRLE